MSESSVMNSFIGVTSVARITPPDVRANYVVTIARLLVPAHEERVLNDHVAELRRVKLADV